jgi:hypothetical protein
MRRRKSNLEQAEFQRKPTLPRRRTPSAIVARRSVERDERVRPSVATSLIAETIVNRRVIDIDPFMIG